MKMYDELVARGVQMEAWSVEDDGADMKDRLKASELLAKAVPQAADDAVTAIEVRIDYGDGGMA